MALPLPSALPVIHVVADNVVRHVPSHSAWAAAVDWLGTNWLTGFLGLATVFLGIAALATIVANDLGQQERLLPLVDLADVRSAITPGPGFSGYEAVAGGFASFEAVFTFDLINDGGGPAKEVRATLVRFGDQEIGIENYLGSISPGQRRACRQPFALPFKTGGYKDDEPFVLVVQYQWLRPGSGEVYIADRFGNEPRPADERPRTTQPRVVVRGPKWLLWLMQRMGMDFG
jgi:hypothetical protein